MDDDRDEDVDVQDIEAFLQGDGEDFLSEEERQAKAARERREARKRRLRSTGEDSGPEKPPPQQKLKLEQIEPPSIQQKPETPSFVTPMAVQQGEDNPDVEDEYDMFSSSVSPPRAPSTAVQSSTKKTSHEIDQQQEWDDDEGYYKASIGEVIALDLAKTSSEIIFRVSGVIGKGVFSTVLKCSTESSNASTPLPPQVALKCIRHNETMAKAANDEIQFLQRCQSSPGIVPLLLPTDATPLEFRGHIILVFPYMEYNLRDVLSKFGKGVGLSLTAVRSYFGQMLSAATHLKQHRLIHSDIKPDNILVNADFSKISVCDFGSAIDGNAGQEMVTPYLVSRFYRSPETILGLIPTYAIDLWSFTVTAAEIFLGKVLFQGKSNNDMLYVMMQHLGPISNRLVRQHLTQAKKFPVPVHFTQDVPPKFQRLTVDPANPEKEVYKAESLQGFSPKLQTKLLKAKSSGDSRTLVLQFSDLLQKCLAFDPSRRIAVKDALQHDFFKNKA